MRLQIKAIALVVAVALVVTSCAGGWGGATVLMPRPVDGRDIALGCPAFNHSTTQPLTLVAAELIDPFGLELVEAFTVPIDSQLAMGAPVPPVPADCDDGVGGDCVANWAKRAPLVGSVVPPDDVLEILLVLRLTSDEPCVYTKGVKVTYKQGWRKHAEEGSCMALVVFTGDDADDTCSAVFSK